MYSKFFLNLIIILVFVYLIPTNSNANIYQLTCKNNKNSTTWVYSLKRKALILTKINNNKTKVNFSINRGTPTSFVSKGVISNLNTNVTYDQKSAQLSMLQTSLRGSNQFYQCAEPQLIKEE